MVKSPSAAESTGKSNSWGRLYARIIGHYNPKISLQSQSREANTIFPLTQTPSTLSHFPPSLPPFSLWWILTTYRSQCGESLMAATFMPDYTEKPCLDKAGWNTLTHAISGLPLQTLAIGERNDIGGGVDTALRAAAPHALHGLVGAVGAVGVQRARLLTGWTCALIGVSWTGRKRIMSFCVMCKMFCQTDVENIACVSHQWLFHR